MSCDVGVGDHFIREQCCELVKVLGAHAALPSVVGGGGASGSSCREVRVFPDDCGAHAQADAHGGDAIPDGGVLLELAGQLGHEAHAGGGQRVAHGDGAAVPVDAGVVVGNAKVVKEGQHLDGEGLVDFKQANVLDGQPGHRRAFSVAGTGPMPMTSGATPA